MSDPILPLAVWQSGTNQNSIPANDNALRIELLNREIISQAVTAQPGSPSDGDSYIIAATHTGAQWATFTPKDLTIYKGGTWYAWAPVEGLVVNVAGSEYKFDGGSWVAVTGSGMANPMTTAGDIIYGGTPSGGVAPPTRLGVGTNGYVLTLSSGLPVWAAASGGFTNPMSAVGDLIVGGAAGAATSLAAGTSTYVLTSNGPGAAPSWQAAGGGGGVTGFTTSLETASPNGTVNVSRIIASGGTTNQDIAISPKGTGSITAQLPDGTTANGNKRGANAVDLQTIRTANTQVAQSSYSVLAGGYGNTISAQYAFIGGGNLNTASAQAAVVSGGDSNTAGGTYGAVTGGKDNFASGAYSRAGGSGSNARSIQASDVFGAGVGNQRGVYVLQRNTSSATPAVATADYNGTAATTNQVTLANNMAMSFSALVAVKRQSSTDTAHWLIEGAIMRGANAGTTTLVGTPTVTALGAAAGASTWAIAVSANTTIGCLSFQVTGQASANLNWMISIQTAEATL